MTAPREIYVCKTCGNIIEILHKGATSLVCCGKPMIRVKENYQDASVEKHVPVLTINGENVSVMVGEIEHPMEPMHFIEWIEVIADDIVYRKDLKPGDKPFAEFKVTGENISARAYCNTHGLWKSA